MISDSVVAAQEQTYDCRSHSRHRLTMTDEDSLFLCCEGITLQGALLPGYTRHRVKSAMYPAIIDKERLRQLSGANIPDEEALNTRGILIKGLSHQDVCALDLFEGEEYTRIWLPVKLTSQSFSIANLLNQTAGHGHEAIGNHAQSASSHDMTSHEVDDTGDNKDEELLEGWTYVWCGSLEKIEPKIWTLEELVKAKECEWKHLPDDWFEVLNRPEDGQLPFSRKHSEIEDGDELKVQGKHKEGYETFGKKMLKYWSFKEGYINLNHGSYGSPPLSVIADMHTLSQQVEQNPDLFMRRSYFSILDETRNAVAKMVSVSQEEVVLVPNTTHGIFNVLDNMIWEEGDILVIFSTTYGAIGQMCKYFADSSPVKLHIISLDFPLTHSEVLRQTEEVLASYNLATKPISTEQCNPIGKTPKTRIRMVLVDVLASNPGVMYPWEEIIPLCKKYNILSLVDGAHAIGQIPLNLEKAGCDFFVSNCHKWLMSHRGGAFFYVPVRNQHMIRTTIPTSIGYESSNYPTPPPGRPWQWAHQYIWTGTQDWMPLFSILPAMKFREKIGGEKRIMQYCHTLAVEGGKRVANKWQTDIMDTPSNELTVAMSNVALPHIPTPKDLGDQAKQLHYLEESMFRANCFAACYVHAGRWWVRFSAQIWNELSDFEYVADIIEKSCLEIKNGDYVEQEDNEEIEKNAGNMPTHDE
ncbi:hypothetical protein L204_105867 [Cryptococcus depauperatus]